MAGGTSEYHMDRVEHRLGDRSDPAVLAVQEFEVIFRFVSTMVGS
jgi:hypothetical protein